MIKKNNILGTLVKNYKSESFKLCELGNLCKDKQK